MSKAPSEFGFPYDAYSIQNDFMKTLYNVFTESKIGIFESPTGTGKSLSLICGSLKWLNDNDESTANAQKPESFKASNEEPDWVNAYQGNQFEHKRELSKQERKRAIKKRIELIKRQEQNQSIIQLSSANEDRSRWKRARKDTTVRSSGSKDQDDEFLLDEYVSDDEDREKLGRSTSTPAGSNSNFSKEVQDLLSRFETHKNIGYSDDEDDGDDDVEEDDFDEVKIYYTSRTHSQLSQFVHEVNKTLYANDIWTVPLGSRKNLCINKSVNKLGNVNRMNEACLDLQKKKKDQCPHLPAMKEKGRWRDFKDRALAKPRDIEDIVKVGESLSICPYYGSRQAAKPARLVVLPYQHLLHANTRESLGISLKDNIVIVDEAHNLMETINSIHTVTLTLCQNQYALRQFLMYIQRYKSRLSGKNVSYIRQIIQIVKAFIGILTPQENEKKDLILGVNEFLHLLGIDHFNMFKIERYLKESNLARKLLGFIEKAQQDQEKEQQELALKNPHAQNTHLSSKPQSLLTIPTLTQIQAFLMTLTNPDKDGRVFISFGNDTPEPQFKYMLLNPAESFRPIVEECKSVVLAGGTMEPISDFMKHLFPYVPDSRITTFSCGHIIPPKNLLTMCIDEGPTRKPFLFNYENRQDTGLIDEVGKSIVNLCSVIPDGVVCFFASFTYLETVYSRWNSAESGNILERLAKKKKIFKEPRESGMVESTLRDYSMHIDSKKEASNTGAILLCVVNGKMSEGINFSDRLGRGVIMVGLPFPNRGSVELNEKIKYIDEHGESGTAAGREYYENLCMRGVNQSIGRAIRHRGDFSTILLLDKRYSTSRIQKKLPSWIGTDIEHCDRFGKSIGKTAGFFRQHKET